MPTKSAEDYLKTLYTLSKNGRAVATSEISQKLRVAPASVTEMLKKLADKDYVEHSPYHGTTLTKRGREVAERMTRKHRLLERFLHDTLRIRKDRIHQMACEMEHALTDDAEESLCRFLKHPDKCPDDEKIIPSCNLPFSSCQECIEIHNRGLEEVGKRAENLSPISHLKHDDTGNIAFIRGEHKILQRLLDMGLTPGTNVTITRVAPLNGPVEVCVRGSQLAIGQDVAANIFVKIGKPVPSSTHEKHRWRHRGRT
jgi:DtxR family Mn-dependent transcriptional regulator